MANIPPPLRKGDTFGYRDKAGQLVLDARAAQWLNDLKDEIKRLGKVSAVPPLRWDEDQAGRRFSIDLPRTIHAKLSGAGPGYGYVEQIFTPGTGWADMTGGITGSNAYEYNGRTGLAGKVVELEYFPVANDWRFQWIANSCKWTFTVRGCNSVAIVGATVNLRQSGSLIATGTTNGSGQLTLSVPAGTYDVEIVPVAGSGYQTYTSSTAHTCAQSTSITLSVDSNYTCRPNGCVCDTQPNSLSITYTYPPGYAGITLPDDTLVLSGGSWIGSATFNYPGQTDLYVGRISPNGCAYTWTYLNTTTNIPSGAGLHQAGMNTCNPFHTDLSTAFSQGPAAGAKFTLDG
jgi:hypothetical protein